MNKQKIVFETYNKDITGLSFVESFRAAKPFILAQIKQNGNVAHVEKESEQVLFIVETDPKNVIFGFWIAFNEVSA